MTSMETICWSMNQFEIVMSWPQCNRPLSLRFSVKCCKMWRCLHIIRMVKYFLISETKGILFSFSFLCTSLKSVASACYHVLKAMVICFGSAGLKQDSIFFEPHNKRNFQFRTHSGLEFFVKPRWPTIVFTDCEVLGGVSVSLQLLDGFRVAMRLRELYSVF